MTSLPHLLLLLLLPSPVPCTVHPEGAHLEPGFDPRSLPVHRSYQRASPDCSEVLETVTEYQYHWRDQQGTIHHAIINDVIQHHYSTLLQDDIQPIETPGLENNGQTGGQGRMASDNKSGHLQQNNGVKIHPYLNCLAQDDQRLIDIIKSKYLHQPSGDQSTMSDKYYSVQVGHYDT